MTVSGPQWPAPATWAVCVLCYFLPLVIHSLLRTLSLVEQWYHSTQDPCCSQKVMVGCSAPRGGVPTAIS